MEIDIPRSPSWKNAWDCRVARGRGQVASWCGANAWPPWFSWVTIRGLQKKIFL